MTKDKFIGPFFESANTIHALDITFVKRGQFRDVAVCGAERVLSHAGDYSDDVGTLTCVSCREKLPKEKAK